MERIPEFIHATYTGENKDDYTLKAKIAMDGLATHPEEAEYIYAWTACFLRSAKQYDECIAHCHKYLPLINIWDCREDTLHALIWALEDTDRFDEAMQVRKQLLEEISIRKPGHEYFVLQDIAEAYEKACDIKHAISYYEKYLEDNIGDMDFYEHLALLYNGEGDYENSAKYYSKAVTAECSNSVWLWSNTGRALALSGKEDEAKIYFQVALKLDPENANSHYSLGLIYQNKNDVYRAMHHYSEALKIQPSFAAVYNNLAKMSFDEEGDVQGAIKYLEKALEQNTDHHFLIMLYTNLSRLYNKICDYDKHEYYKCKLLEAIGFPVEFTDEDDDEEYDKDDDDLLK